MKDRIKKRPRLARLARRMMPVALARVIMLAMMINGLLLGFLSSTHASAQISGMALICGPNGIIAIPLDEQQPDDLSLIDRERCITSCLAALTGTPGMVVEPVQIKLPPLRFESPQPEETQALTPLHLEVPRARGPPVIRPS